MPYSNSLTRLFSIAITKLLRGALEIDRREVEWMPCKNQRLARFLFSIFENLVTIYYAVE